MKFKLNLISVIVASCCAISITYADSTTMSNTTTSENSIASSSIMSPIGYWLQKDDNGKPQSVFSIYQDKETGKVDGRILVPFFKTTDGKITPPDINCLKCGKGSKNGYSYDYTKGPASRVQNMKILWGFVKSESKPNKGNGSEWDDGSLLDPESGKVYSGYMYTQKWGRELYLRGYWGFSFIGRTQIWQRITEVTANKLVNMCGLASDGTHYKYTNKAGKIINKTLWNQCSNITQEDLV